MYKNDVLFHKKKNIYHNIRKTLNVQILDKVDTIHRDVQLQQYVKSASPRDLGRMTHSIPVLLCQRLSLYVVPPFPSPSYSHPDDL